MGQERCICGERISHDGDGVLRHDATGSVSCGGCRRHTGRAVPRTIRLRERFEEVIQ